MGLEMATEEEPKFMKAVLWAALLIGGVIGGMILQQIQWVMADNLGLGWSIVDFRRGRALLVGYGIIIPAIVIALSIIGSKIHEETVTRFFNEIFNNFRRNCNVIWWFNFFVKLYFNNVVFY